VHPSCELLGNFPLTGQTLSTFRNPMQPPMLSARTNSRTGVSSRLISNTSANSGSSSNTNITLEQCLREHTLEETLDETNTVYCSDCKQHTRVKKLVRFWYPKLPQVLILVLKRFEFRESGGTLGPAGLMHREKIDSLVDFPVSGLDMTAFCSGLEYGTNHNPTLTSGRITEGTNALDVPGLSLNAVNDRLYDLFAVCNHFGRLGSGHYTAMARDWRGSVLSDTWVCRIVSASIHCECDTENLFLLLVV
jgi:ubiquitin C-terminal hydrolase